MRLRGYELPRAYLPVHGRPTDDSRRAGERYFRAFFEELITLCFMRTLSSISTYLNEVDVFQVDQYTARALFLMP